MSEGFNKGKDLTKEPPRSPKVMVGGYVMLGRTIDKCRALLWGNIGEYHFDCPLDNTLFGFKGIKGDDFKVYVAEDHNDDEIAAWVSVHGTPRTQPEIALWNKDSMADNYANKPPEKKSWLEGENVRLGLDKDSTIFRMLDADDAASFKK